MQLIDYLAGLFCCEYLSDLPAQQASEQQAAQISSLTDEDFPPAQFFSAAHYLDQQADCSTIESAKAVILSHFTAHQ